LHGLALAGGKCDAGLGLDPRDGFRGIDRRPGQSANAERLDPSGNRPFGAMQTGEEDAAFAIDGVDSTLISGSTVQRSTMATPAARHTTCLQ
jgi:hypothetical protein